MALNQGKGNKASIDLTAKSLLNTNPYFISGTSKVDFDPPAYAIQFPEATVIAAIASNVQGDSLVGETLPAGFILYASVYSITLTSGSCIANRF